MICDAEAHQYLISEVQGETVNVISHTFCKQLIFFFREYLLYKVFYFDTMVENMMELEKCYYDGQKEKY